MIKRNFVVLSGAMGAGKSTMLAQLSSLGIACVREPAREVLAEQRSIDGEGVPEKNPELFCQLMLGHALHDFAQRLETPNLVVFDRGLPDLIAYAELFSIDSSAFCRAATLHRYHPVVLFFEGWEEIYTTDSERKIDFQGANDFGKSVKAVYKEMGYHVHVVPHGSVQERTEHLLGKLISLN